MRSCRENEGKKRHAERESMENKERVTKGKKIRGKGKHGKQGKGHKGKKDMWKEKAWKTRKGSRGQTIHEKAWRNYFLANSLLRLPFFTSSTRAKEHRRCWAHYQGRKHCRQQSALPTLDSTAASRARCQRQRTLPPPERITNAIEHHHLQRALPMPESTAATRAEYQRQKALQPPERITDAIEHHHLQSALPTP